MMKFLTFISLLLVTSYNVCYGKTLLILGDSLSAGYRLSIDQAWPSQLNKALTKFQRSVTVINASISGDTTGNGLERLPALLKQHQPDYVLIELGANDGLRGFPLSVPQNNLVQMVQLIKSTHARPLLMQIEIPPNYGKRYTQKFAAIYPNIAKQEAVPLIPFYLAQIIQKTQWIQDDGLHPNALAQPWIAQFIAANIHQYM